VAEKQLFHAFVRARPNLERIRRVEVQEGDETLEMPFVEDDDVIEQVLRQLPTKRSATPFCPGLRKLVRLGSMPKLLMVLTTSSLKFAARSKIR
jgi:hypothetical protein